MARIRKLVLQENPWIWSPNEGGQKAFLHDYRHRYCAFCGGWGSGKSWAGARKLVDLHIFNALTAQRQPTFVKGLVISPTYSLARTVNLPQLQEAFDTMGLKHRFIADPKRYCIVLPDLGMANKPSEILVRSADAPMLLAGFEVGHIWGDEAARWYRNDDDPMQDAFLQAEGRLRAPAAKFHQMNLTFTHEGEETRVFERFETEATRDHALHRASTIENRFLPAAWVDSLKANLSAPLAGQYLEGHAARFGGGLVYDSFDQAGNEDSQLRLSADWPLQLAIDFNVDPGCHVEIGQYLVDCDLLITTHEIYADRMNVKTLLPRLRAFFERELAGYEPRPGGWKFLGKLELFGDASGNNSQAATGESCWDVLRGGLEAMGIPYRLRIPAANPHVADRVNAVNCALRNMNGVARYKIHPRCARLLRDFRTLKWSGNELDKRDRHLSHASDADGYRVHYLLPIRPRQTQAMRVGVL